MKNYIKIHNFIGIYNYCLIHVANYNSDSNILVDNKVYINFSNKQTKDVFDYHFNKKIESITSFKLGEKILILNSNVYDYNIQNNIIIDKVPFIKHIKNTWNELKKVNSKKTLGITVPYNVLERNVVEMIGKDFIEIINYPSYIIANKTSDNKLDIDNLNKIRKKLFIRNFIT